MRHLFQRDAPPLRNRTSPRGPPGSCPVLPLRSARLAGVVGPARSPSLSSQSVALWTRSSSYRLRSLSLSFISFRFSHLPVLFICFIIFFSVSVSCPFRRDPRWSNGREKIASCFVKIFLLCFISFVPFFGECFFFRSETRMVNMWRKAMGALYLCAVLTSIRVGASEEIVSPLRIAQCRSRCLQKVGPIRATQPAEKGNPRRKGVIPPREQWRASRFLPGRAKRRGDLTRRCPYLR